MASASCSVSQCATSTAPMNTIAIVGCGLIGQSLGVIFAANSINIRYFDSLFDKDPTYVAKVKSSLLLSIDEFKQNQTFQRRDEELTKNQSDVLCCSAEDLLDSRIAFCTSLEDCLSNVDLVYECVFEDAQVKTAVLRDVDKILSEKNQTHTIITSSTSCIMPSVLSGGMKNKENFLVTHPINPPFYLQLVEIVPAPWTNKSVVDRVVELMKFVGQKPVCLKREAKGFGVNRIQYSVFNAAWNLVKEGIMSPEDVDVLMVNSLGPRYGVIGAFETTHCNAPGGIRDYMKRYSGGMVEVSRDMGDYKIEYDNETLAQITEYLERKVPVEHLKDLILYRNHFLKQVKNLKK